MNAEILSDLELERVAAGLSKGGQGGQQKPASQGGTCPGGCGR